jgi:hypothetical protein
LIYFIIFADGTGRKDGEDRCIRTRIGAQGPTN